MRRAQTIGRALFAALTCLALIVWSVIPSVTHAPIVFETIQDHLEMVEDHGHSHGFEEDLYWAMHGHSHDVADHGGRGALAARGVDDFNSGMPAFESVTTDDEIWDILAYIRSTWPERVQELQAGRNPPH